MSPTATPRQAYDRLTAQERELAALSGALSILHWDKAVMMPTGGGEMRAEHLSVLARLHHQKLVDPARPELIAQAGQAELEGAERANLAEIARIDRRARALSPDFVERLARARSTTEMVWRTASAENDFAAVAGPLADLLALVREEAALLAEALGLEPYDALLDGYDPGMRMARVEPLFDELAATLPEIVAKIEAAQAEAMPVPLTGDFSVARQERLGRDIMARLGFDFEHGRLDVSHHPFTGGVPDDIRITTRYNGEDFAEALMGVIHETGHALYEAGLPRQWRGQPVGRARGLTLHESQSLFYEMQLGRHPAFLSFLLPLARAAFDGQGPGWESDNFQRHYLRVERGLIRVHADEATYPLHIVTRTRLERAMIAGDLQVAELPQAWNEAMRDTLGIVPPSDRQGCLQDIHWYSGAFGYFPTYSLGALAAAQLFKGLRTAHADVLDDIAAGRFGTVLEWVRANVHQVASSAASDEILEAASGEPLGASAFLSHLRQRYLRPS